MKVIFLDIDGVLNVSETYDRIDSENKLNGTKKIYIDEFRVQYLSEIVKRTGAEIVLSSSLRGMFKKVDGKVVARNNHFAPQFVSVLAKYGLYLYDIIPKVDSDNNYLDKGEAIKSWLSNHLDVESFVILDDSTVEFMDFVGINLIKLNNLEIGEIIRDMSNSIGLGEEHIDEAVSILNNKEVCRERRRTR